jgi:hypothetical protein
MGFIVTLFYPLRDFSAIRRIAENYLVSPVLAESVLLNGKIPLAFMVLIVSARVKSKAKFLI